MTTTNIHNQNSYRIALFLWGAGLLTLVILSLLPPGNEPSFSNLVNDKIRHFTAYALLALAACYAGRGWRQRLILSTCTFIVSVLVEFLQPLTGRDFELLDIVANLSGVLAGIAFVALIFRYRRRCVNL
ncbi:VanZ family protein [Sneathiella sp. HT1-7]|jgi:VanZ family protein|uniref:VanZ family protein n=1 Tax=Sneathiella sp. HT1-7 TaxID=2887192 RepID=UPI001D133CB5|nr:VanZ family protein [Sneathiella sp. HT1-7]MCC3303895.1 VanZ family protein [Sneathiella sp. HT1-7]